MLQHLLIRPDLSYMNNSTYAFIFFSNRVLIVLEAGVYNMVSLKVSNWNTERRISFKVYTQWVMCSGEFLVLCLAKESERLFVLVLFFFSFQKIQAHRKRQISI